MHKKIIPAVIAAATLFFPLASHADNYAGNGATGFGGKLGAGSLTVTSTGSNITFQFNPSGTFSSDDVVVYIDSKTGGFGSTSTFTDTADGGRTAVSGFSGSGRTLATFASGFTADYAIEFENNTFTGLFDLSTPSNFGFVSGNTPTSGGPYTIVVPRTSLGVAAGAPIRFVASLISTSGYRSNETIGASTTVPGSVGDTPNAGFTGSTTFTNFNTYVTAAPEPSECGSLLIGAGILGGTILVRRRRQTA